MLSRMIPSPPALARSKSRRESNGKGRLLGRMNRVVQLHRGEASELDRLVVATGRQPLAVRREGDRCASDPCHFAFREKKESRIRDAAITCLSQQPSSLPAPEFRESRC